MSEPDANSQDKPDTSPNSDSGEMLQSGMPNGEREGGGAAVGGGKTITVFGALFGAAAAVPT